MFSIRPLTPRDQPFLWEMLYQSLHVPEGQAAFPREIIYEPNLRHYVENWGLPGDLGFIALEDDRPVGAVWLRKLRQEDPGYGFVDDQTPEMGIALLPAYRGRGLGGALLEALFEAAKEIYPAISLSVSIDNPARRLYERMGFAPVKQEGDSLTMLKHLGKQQNGTFRQGTRPPGPGPIALSGDDDLEAQIR